MLRQLRELYSLLTPLQRKRLARLQLLVVLMSIVEILGVVSIAPFMAIVGDMSRLEGNSAISTAYALSGAGDPVTFLIWAGLLVLVILSAATMLSMFTVWRLSIYGNQVGADVATRLYSYYLHQPWIFHTSSNSSQLTNQVAQECQRLTNAVIKPFMEMNAKLVLVILMVVAIVALNPQVAAVGLLVLLIAYFALYRTVRTRLIDNGQSITEAQQARFQLLNAGLGGIKDVLLLGRQETFVSRFGGASQRLASALGTTQALSRAPRYAMELLALGSVIGLVVFLLVTYDGDLGAILPILSIYALAGFKLLPAFQQIYLSLATIRGNIAAFEAIRDDLRRTLLEPALSGPRPQLDTADTDLPRSQDGTRIRLEGVTFSYPSRSTPAVDDISMEIPSNATVGLVGPSGSGKSTLIDILLGLIEPNRGQLYIDEKALKPGRLSAWQQRVGFVPQAIYLLDGSVRENIAFGLPPDVIDETKILQAASLAHLDELLVELPSGLDTRVGERGVQLSGGQRQRIGIARALYDDADVLIFDEATSALDGVTEQSVMRAISDFAGRKTIVMIAHRLNTVKNCNLIYFMSAGRIIDQGTYDELSHRNPAFRKMAELA